MLSLLLSAFVAADDPRAAVAEVLNQAKQAARAPAIAGGWTTVGRGSTFDAVGIRARGQATPCRAADRFHLGSNGKAITATLAGLLVDAGLLRWNTTIAQAFPEAARTIRPEFRGVTLEELLNHRSGVSEGDDALQAEVLAFRGPPHEGRARFIPRILAMPPGNPRGEFVYSNVGYSIAGAMIERAAGTPFETAMQRLLFEPLEIDSAGFGPPGRTIRPPDQPRGHNDSGAAVGVGQESELPLLMSPAGLMHMNMRDWAKFLRLHLGTGGCILSPATVDRLHRPDPRPAFGLEVRYGFGWLHFRTPEGPVLWHNGSNGFWYSSAKLDLRRGTAVFAACNQVGTDSAVDGVLPTLERLIPAR